MRVSLQLVVVFCSPSRNTTKAVPFIGIPGKIPLPNAGSFNAHCEPNGQARSEVHLPAVQRYGRNPAGASRFVPSQMRPGAQSVTWLAPA
jgi:hypothetical protein